MTTTRTYLFWLFGLTLCAGALAASAIVYPAMPDRVATHWDLYGKVDGHGHKSWALFLLPAVMLGVLGLYRALPGLSPKGFEIDVSQPAYLTIMAASLVLLAYSHGVILSAAIGHAGGGDGREPGRALTGGLFLFLGLIGALMGKVRRNFYIGLRLPWTLASDRVWDDTHRLASWTLGLGGLAGLAVVAAGLPIVAAFGVLGVSLAIPAVYSFLHYKGLERRGAL